MTVDVQVQKFDYVFDCLDHGAQSSNTSPGERVSCLNAG